MAKPTKTRNNNLPSRQNSNALDTGDKVTRLDNNVPLAQRQLQMSVHKEYKGPLPPPEQLQEFDNVVPGAANRIMTLMEEQARHRMHLEKTVIEGDNRRANWGVVIGAAVAVLGLVLSFIMVMSGFGIYGTIIGVLDLATLVGVFVYGTNSRRKERENKAEALKGRKA